MKLDAIEPILGELRAAATRAAREPLGAGEAPNASVEASFAALLRRELEQVAGAQEGAARLARDFELEASTASLSDVMIASQKATISFQQLVQVRNKLVSAYHEIMNMQV